MILVFFGEDNWGKLTNMSESGMAIEFSKPPSSLERVKFTFQAMGCMPMPRNGKALGDSFEAPGRIVWTREFERGAGVQFVDLGEASREQIRQWLSFEASPNTSAPAVQAKTEGLPILAELLSRLEPGSNSQSAGDKKGLLLELDMPVPVAETVPEPDPAFPESPVAESYEGADSGGRGEAAKGRLAELPVTPHPSVARLTFLVVSGCLAAFAVTAGVRIFMTRAAHRADAAVRAPDPGPRIGESTAEASIPSPVPSSAAAVPSSLSMSSATSSSVAAAPPFQVDVLDASGRSWILWFVRGGAKDKNRQISYQPSESTNSSAPTRNTAKRQQEAAPQEPPATHTFTMVVPNLSHPMGSGSSGNPPEEVPAIPTELTPSSGEPLSGALGRQMAPAPPPVHFATGGMVQQPRLIQSGPPVYPQLAQSIRVSGDVDVDALIDAAGNVTAVKVISGPVLLQHAAMETVRRWKYEPARLDGQAVAMHLTVTVRFHLN